MVNKISIQISLLLLCFFLIFIYYYKFFKTKELEIDINSLAKKNQNELQTNTEGNIVKDVIYESIDSNKNQYTITSKVSEFDEKLTNIILMETVEAKIIFNNGTAATLVSKNAIYDTLTNNTEFFNNVSLNYLSHNINCNNIDIFFDQNRLEAYNDLVYRNLDVSIIADKADLDLINKNTKIYMLDNSQVKILKSN